MRAKAVDAGSRWSANQKPTIGGVIFLTGLIFGTIYCLVDDIPAGEYILLFFCGFASFMLGLWDDLRRISASKKLFGQIFIALTWIVADLIIHDNVLTSEIWLSALVSFVIIVGLMNAVNMLDNMDAVSAVSALPAMVWTFIFACNESSFFGFFLVSILAFLIYNWAPSKIFMGDSGSMLLGFVVAWIVLNVHPITLESESAITSLLLLPVLCLGYIVDTSVVVFNRIRHGISPSKGGRDHTSHHLVYAGFSEGNVALIFVLVALTQIPLMCLVLNVRDVDNLLLAFAIVSGYFFLLFVLMFSISVRNLRSGKFIYRK